jgi:rhodanese-related sulfurtransferase
MTHPSAPVLAATLRSRALALVLVLAVLATVAALGPGSAAGDGKAQRARPVSPAALATMLEKKDFVLLNVHVPYAGEIEPTDLFIPFDRIAAAGELPADRAARIVVYCRSGPMSAIATRTLIGLGYTDVWDLEGGMVAWRDAGHSLVHKNR